MKKISSAKKILAITTLICVCLLLVGIIYVNDYYHPTEYAISALQSDEQVEVFALEDDTLVFQPVKSVRESAGEQQKGLIFYPGGKVAFEAYAPLMHELAEQGILCVLPEMPCNLAVMDMSAAEGIPEQFPEIEEWYLGGHSLGGSMAAAYAADAGESYVGLILLASYSTENLADSDLRILSIYGSEDKVLNPEKYETYRTNLPQDMTEVVIEGGCHAYFGSYGAQEGDGIPVITEEEQRQQTVTSILSFVEEM